MTKSEEMIARMSPEQQEAMVRFRKAHYDLCREFILKGTPNPADVADRKFTIEEMGRFSDELDVRNVIVYSVCVEALARIINTRAHDATEEEIETKGLFAASCVHVHMWTLISNLSVQMFQTVEKIFQESHARKDDDEDGDDAPHLH